MQNFSLHKKRGIPKNVKLLGVSSFFNDFASDMISSIIPFYLTALGGGGISIGALSGLKEGLSSLFKVFGGWHSDKVGKRKIFIFFGYIISIFSRIFLIFANSANLILGLVSFERFGKLRDAPRDAIIISYKKRRGKMLAFHQLMDNLGGILGIALVIILFWKLNFGYKKIIIIASFISVFSLFPLIFVKDHKIRKTRKSLFSGIKNLNPKLKFFIFVSSVFSFANFGLYMFLMLLAKEISGNIITSIFLYILFILVYSIFIMFFGNLSDKIGRKKILNFGYILFTLVCFLLIYCNNIIYLAVLFSLYGLVFSITNSNQKAYVSDVAGKMKGTAIGFFYFVTGITSIFGGILAGFLWEFSPKHMFTYLSMIGFISIFLLNFVQEKIKKN